MEIIYMIGYMLLTVVASKGNEHARNLPSDKGIQESKENYTNTSLLTAARDGDLNAVRYFAERGDDVNAVFKDHDIYNTSVLLTAIENGHIDIINVLLDNHADLNAKIPRLIRYPWHDEVQVKASPLLVAISLGNLNVTKLLIDRGAHVNSGDDENSTPLDYAAAMGHKELVIYLIRNGADINHADSHGNTAMHWATYGDQTEIVEILLKNGANVDALNLRGQSPLHYATDLNKPKSAEVLLRAGADVRKIAYDGSTPIHSAICSPFNYATNDRIHMVNLIINQRPDAIDVKNWMKSSGDNRTALHTAVYQEELQIVKVLLEAGANVHSRTDYFYFTPLHLAAILENFPIFRILIENGGRTDFESRFGDTPVDLLVPRQRVQLDEFIAQQFE